MAASVSPRWSNAAGDVVLTVQLVGFLLDWLRRRPRRGLRSYQAAHALYAANLALAALFTAVGVCLHIADPLPQRPHALWVLFLLGCVSTPVLFPTICTCALYPRMSRASAALCWAWPIASGSAHAWLALTGVDLSAVIQPPTVELFGRRLDGRSVGGEAAGVSFDLLSSIPCTRGDCLFLHAGGFTVAVLGVLLILLGWLRAARAAAPAADRHTTVLVRRLTLAVALMNLGQVVMIPMIAAVGVARTLDAWHAMTFLVMALAYSALCGLLCEPDARGAVGFASGNLAKAARE